MINQIILGVVGPWQIVVVLVIVLLLFGGKKIPELMRGLGSGIKEFKKAMKDDDDKDNKKDESIPAKDDNKEQKG